MDGSVQVRMVSLASLAHLPAVLSYCLERYFRNPGFKRLLQPERKHRLHAPILLSLVRRRLSSAVVIHNYISVIMPCARHFRV